MDTPPRTALESARDAAAGAFDKVVATASAMAATATETVSSPTIAVDPVVAVNPVIVNTKPADDSVLPRGRGRAFTTESRTCFSRAPPHAPLVPHRN